VPDVYGRWDLRKRKVLRLEKKNDGVMDDKSGDDHTTGSLLVQKLLQNRFRRCFFMRICCDF